MIRIGIVGSDNSHADRFCELTNLERPDLPHVDGLRVVAICGADPKRTQEVATNGKIEKIVSGPREMVGLVDAAFVVYRHGGLHRENVLPLLEAGIPVFVDKPFACSVADAEAMLNAADRRGVAITSFSTARVAASFVKFLGGLKPETIRGGSVVGPCDPDSEYGGHFFYGVHAVEVMLAAFGHRPRSLVARRVAKTIQAIVSYERQLVSLRLQHDAGGEFLVTVYTSEGTKPHAIDMSTCYYDGLVITKRMLETGKRPLSDEELLAPVRVLEAIGRALKSGSDESV